ncbi:unnamed protein product, partial [Cuscuta europaea]
MTDNFTSLTNKYRHCTYSCLSDRQPFFSKTHQKIKKKIKKSRSSQVIQSFLVCTFVVVSPCQAIQHHPALPFVRSTVALAFEMKKKAEEARSRRRSLEREKIVKMGRVDGEEIKILRKEKERGEDGGGGLRKKKRGRREGGKE